LEISRRRIYLALNLTLKVCGITRESDAIAARDSGADIIGVVRARSSKRFVETKFSDLLSSSGFNVAAVYDDREYLKNSFSEEEYIQMHYLHTPDEISQIRKMSGKKIISVISAERLFNPDFRIEPYVKEADLVLIEQKPLIVKILNDLNPSNKKVGLAGGIKPEDIDKIVKKGFQFIDLSSSIEISPGIKDLKMLSRIKEVRTSLESHA
jgi:phosphoribosylanthranilate isomerase